MKEYYLAKCIETGKYLIRQQSEEGQDIIHSAFHKYEIARNTCLQLNERAAYEDSPTSFKREKAAQ